METQTIFAEGDIKNKNEEIRGPDLWNYLDYRVFLGDYYNYRRQVSVHSLRPYTYGVFSAAANIRSPNYLKMIIDGKRNLSEEMIGRFSKALSFTKDQQEEFRILVNYCQTVQPVERNILLKQLSELRLRNQLKNGVIDKKVWSKVSNWVTWVIYAMFDQEGVDFRVETLRDLLRGKASSEEIHSAIEALIQSGEVILTGEGQGSLEKAKTFTEVSEEIPVAIIRKLQSELIYLGLESLFNDNPMEREFGSLTLSLTKSEFEDLRFKLRQWRKQIHKDSSIKRMTSKGERVYQLNLQLFPVTDRRQK